MTKLKFTRLLKRKKLSKVKSQLRKLLLKRRVTILILARPFEARVHLKNESKILILKKRTRKNLKKLKRKCNYIKKHMGNQK